MHSNSLFSPISIQTLTDADDEGETNDDINSPTNSDCSTDNTSSSYLRKKKYDADIELDMSLPLKIVNDVKDQNEKTIKYPCMKCSRIFVERDQLNIHYTHTHREKPQYVCEICSMIFLVKRELSTHLRIHSGEQPHKCTICEKEFGTRQLLKKHFMWHTGERSHICPHCPKAFFQKGHLTQHLMIHKGGRPHQCSLCEKTFIFKFDLNRHMKIHAERGYSCQKCGRCFPKQSTLDEHHNKCRKRFYSKKNLNLTERQAYSSKFIQKNLESSSVKLENSKLSNKNILLNSSFTIFSPNKKTTLVPVKNFESGNKLCNKKKISDINKLENTLSNNQTNTNINYLNLIKNLNDLLTITTTNIYQNSNSNTTSQQKSSYYYNSLLQLPLNLEQQLASFQHFLKPSTLNSTLFIENNMLQKDPMNDSSFLHTLNILNAQQPIYYCFLCSKKLENYLMYILHWDLVHFKNNVISSKSKFNFLQELSRNNLQKDDLVTNDDKKIKTKQSNALLFLNSSLLQEFLKQNNINELKCDNYGTISLPSKESNLQKTSQMLSTFLKLSNQKNNNLNINVNNFLSKNNQFKKQYPSSKLFSNDATISKINSMSLPNFAITLPSETAHSLFNQNVTNKEILCNNLSQHCKNCQEKQQTLEKQLINTQQKLIEMREMIQKVEVIANVLLKKEKKCKNLDEFVSDKTNTQLNKKKKQGQLTL